MTHAMENMNQDNFEEIILSFGKTETPYKVPQGYFETFADVVLAQVRIKDYSRENTFSVPAGYFETFADTVLQKIKNETVQNNEIAEELKDIAPLLATIGRKNVYSVPAGYFESFRVNTNAKTKVVSLSSNKNKKSTWKGLTVAASLLAAVLTLGLIVNNENESAESAVQQTKTAYASIEGVNRDSAKPTNAQTVGAYLNNPSSKNEVQDAKIVVPQNMKVIDVSNEINTISSQDLEEYLSSTPAIN